MEEYSAYRSAELAELYDELYSDVADLEFWTGQARITGGPLLELGCGTGRVLLPLARAGYEVAGIDTAPHMLARCMAKLSAEPAEVRARTRVVTGDMTSFQLGQRFATIYCAFATFHHLESVEQQLACLARCGEHLLPDGTLILDLINPDPAPNDATPEIAAASPTPESTDTPNDDRLVSGSVRIVASHRLEQRNDCEVTYEIVEADGARRSAVERFSVRLIFRYELEHLLYRAGFEIEALYGDYDRSELVDESLGMIVVAKRLAPPVT